jgi:predicted PurR-regulated permease PerM
LAKGETLEESSESPARADRLTQLGLRAWALVGIAVLAVIIYTALASMSGLIVPLVVAVVVGALCAPLVDLVGRYTGRRVAAFLVLCGLILIGVGSLVVAVRGVADQAPEIRAEVTAGLERLGDWLEAQDLDFGTAADLTRDWEERLSDAAPGLVRYLPDVFSTAAAFLVGIGVGLFILYYVLADWPMLKEWIGSHLGVPRDLGSGIVADAIWSTRRYFYVLTITALVTAVLIGLTAAILGVPLAFIIGLVTFVTSYVPYLGAIVSAAFAVLIALGSGGILDAVIILVVVLAVQNVVQPLMTNRMTASELDLHPVVAFGSTIVGAAIAGVLGATLSAPVLAMLIRIYGRVNHYESTGGA